MLALPVAAMQKVATVTSPAESLGKSPVAPATVTGGTGRPVRLIPGEPGRVWKHGTEVSLLQQPWLSPPLRSTQIMWLGSDGSGVMLTQALPVQLPVPQPEDEQPSSATGTPLARFSVQGLDPPAPGVWSVPVVIGRGMVRVARGDPGGGQPLESLNSLFDASEFCTRTVPSTWQACPILGPLSQVPVSQRGQTLVWSVMNTCECRSTSPLISPVATLAVPVAGAVNTLTTQTGTPAATSGSGGPKVSVLIEPAPVGPFAVHGVVPAASHPLRQSLSFEFAGTGKLCDVPVQPLSRSVPWSSVVKIASSGPPAAFGGQAASGTALATQAPVGGGIPHFLFFGFFLQTKMNLSVSGPPEAALAVTLIVSFCPEVAVRAAESPHACAPLRSLGGTSAGLSTVMPVSAGTVVHFFVASSTHTWVSNVQLPLHASWMILFF